MPPSKKAPEFKPRRCRYCKLVFVPVLTEKNKNPHNAESQKFCCPAHRKAYHLNGGLNWERLMARVENQVRKIVRDELSKTMEELRTDLRNALHTGAGSAAA